MEINQNSLNEFANSIPEKARIERRDIIEGGKFEDLRVRRNFGRAIDRWFCEHFGAGDSKDYVRVEGLAAIPKDQRGPSFFGARMYPDAALILPDSRFKIAVELDHGNKGSQIRNALAKASFSRTLGRYDRALVLFFIDRPKLIGDFIKGNEEKRILDLYQKRFHTSVYFL
jgi:hypothetical protein